ncbi:MAG: vanXY [Herbinix sp.]|jgi:D-alanyl-D-alanine carboxypeptidase|nr:vanXY [Herbinix sp.]
MDEYVKIRDVIELFRYCRLPYFEQCNVEHYLRFKERNELFDWEQIITFVNIGLHNEFYTNIRKVYDPGSLTALVNKYNQLPGDYIPGDLEEITQRYSSKCLLLRRDARKAYEEMSREAEEDGILLDAISTFRSYPYQKQVYFKNLTPDISLEEYQKIRDKVSARPGHSEHQTGYAVDINDLEQTFEDTPESRWLMNNAYRYGFILRYPKGKEHITGYDYEPWHYRYVGINISKDLHCSDLTYDEYYVRFIKPYK